MNTNRRLRDDRDGQPVPQRQHERVHARILPELDVELVERLRHGPVAPRGPCCSGAAVIASDAGAWPDIIRQGIDGYSVSGNQQAINSTLKTLLDSPQLLLEMGAEARQHAEQHYSIDREARQLTDHLLSLQ